MPVHAKRTRERGAFVGSAFSSRVVGTNYLGNYSDITTVNTGTSGTDTDARPVGNDYSLITDCKTSRDPGGDLPQAPVDHVRFNRAVAAPPFTTINNVSLKESWTITWKAFGPLIFRFGSNGKDVYFPLPSAAERSKFGLKAFTAINSQFPEKISLGNFLLELKDLPAMALDVVSKFKTWKAAIEAGKAGPPPRLTIGELASDHLAWNFGYAPFIGDLATLGKLLVLAADRLAHLKRTRGKQVKAGFSMVHDYGGTPIVLPVLYRGWVSNTGRSSIRIVRTHLECHMRAGGHVYHDMRYLDGPEGTLRAIAGIAGFTNPFKVAWNAMPFSFVADWLFNVSNSLATMAAQDKECSWGVTRLSHSFVVKAAFRVEVTDHRGNVYPWFSFSGQRYVREPGLPVYAGSITMPSPQQLILLAACGLGKSNWPFN